MALYMESRFEKIALRHQHEYHSVVPFDSRVEKLAPIDLTAENRDLTADIFNETDDFNKYINDKRNASGAKYLVGGYNELRALYGRSELFSADNNVDAL